MAASPEQMELVFAELARWGAPTTLVDSIKRNYNAMANEATKYHKLFITLRDEGKIGDIVYFVPKHLQDKGSVGA